jgi:serine/threonine protein kinase
LYTKTIINQQLILVHRDITTKNILISKPDIKGHSRSVISDFGHCKELENLDKATLSSKIGTPGWTSPEIVRWARSIDQEKEKITIVSQICR